LTEQQQRDGADYNFRHVDKSAPQREGLRAFAIDGGVVHHTYFTYARDVEALMGPTRSSTSLAEDATRSASSSATPGGATTTNTTLPSQVVPPIAATGRERVYLCRPTRHSHTSPAQASRRSPASPDPREARRADLHWRGGVLGGPGWTRAEILDVPAVGQGPVLRLVAIRPPATRTVETAASPILRGLLVGDPVGMLLCNHVEELDQTAAEPRGQLLKPGAQRALAWDAGVAEPVLGLPGVVVTLRERLDRLVVSAVTDSATPRAEIPEPQAGSTKTAVLRGRHTSDHGFEVVATLRVRADVPNRGVAVILAPTRGGSTV
jgi:hypothetical protein